MMFLPSFSLSSKRLGNEGLREFKDRLRPLGSGRVDLSMNDENGLATLVLDNHDRRNGEKWRDKRTQQEAFYFAIFAPCCPGCVACEHGV